MTFKLPRIQARFADYLRKGMVFTTRRYNGTPMQIVAPPVLFENAVGERSYVHLHVELTGTGRKGTMTLRPSEVVFVQAEKEKET